MERSFGTGLDIFCFAGVVGSDPSVSLSPVFFKNTGIYWH
jgi:hypothetical protein